ncbi:class I SAM-dependent methyltransferase [Hyphomonas sp.]|jgi:SAM-dependent methyltransferase|uniref:class I SAM-dependent methyltransferase n=1 Tax=Hyphomonas sp. TaxID=87 RepID=UPI0032D94332
MPPQDRKDKERGTMSMANKDQEEMWNGVGGKAWVHAQTLLDTAFQPFADILVKAVTAASATSVLDIGCGTGATTLAMAEALGPDADCLGLDISETMITHARKRAAETGSTAEFIIADAETHPFEAGRFDVITSRFGVMFFEDPVAAFRNLNRAAQPGTNLIMLSWRGPAENPFMTAAETAARPLLPGLPEREPNARGQFGFADSTRVESMLTEAGWSDGASEKIDVPCRFPLSTLDLYVSLMGPVGYAMAQGVDEETRTKVSDAVRGALMDFVEGDEIVFTAACWKTTARAV